jgi:NADP-dependent 3-hydroxy acid dehydrogenase YdfG
VNLSGETCLVTGANRGIGRAIATELARREARVLAGVRELERWQPIEETTAVPIKPVRMDLGSRESIDACCDALGAELDRVGVLVNNAGRYVGGLLESQDPAAYYEMYQANLIGLTQLTQRLLPHMRAQRRGKIVNNASIVAHAPFPGSTSYAASKAGVSAFTQALRRELEDTQLTVLELVTPGVDTDMMDAVQEIYDEHVSDTSNWDHVDPAEWAEQVAGAIEDDTDTLNPGGAELLAKLSPKWVLDLVAGRAFSR